MNVSIEVNSEYSPIGEMAFSANWRDETYRYHVWLGLRPDIDGERVPYPVKISDTIYKNTIAEVRGGNTIRMNLDAKVNAKIKAEIKRVAQYDTLIALFDARKAEREASDKMRAEADKLNRIFDAVRLLDTAEQADLNAVRVMMNTTRI